MGIKHAFVSSKDQGSDSSLVSKNEWNAEHVGYAGPDSKPYNWNPPSSANALDDEFCDFTGQSGPINGLDAKWSKRNMGTSTWLRLDDAYAPGCAGFDVPTGQNVSQYIYQAAPSGDFTIAVRFYWQYLSDRQMWGPVIVDTSGNGMGIRVDSGDTTPRLMEINSWEQTGTVTDLTPTYNGALLNFQTMTAFLRYVSSTNTFYAAMTMSDRALLPFFAEVSRTRTITAAYVGFGRSYGSGVSKVLVDYFRRTA